MRKIQITDELLYYCFQCQIAFFDKNATNATFLIETTNFHGII